MKKVLLTLLNLTFMGIASQAQNVNIPDSNFKAYLVNNYSINSNFDGQIQTSEAAKYTGSIKCGVKKIKDLTGIEAFPKLSWLD